MNKLYFVNPGQIDIRAVTTMGVHVKQGASPIGYFGTGLKYAIATLLRHGQGIRIYSGVARYDFASQRELIRGEPFDVVVMAQDGAAPIPLGFTTALGRNWTLENAYREIYSNCRDEAGDPEVAEQDPLRITGGPMLPAEFREIGREGFTVIELTGREIYATHTARRQIILDPVRKPLWSCSDLEIYLGTSDRVYYRGIAAMRSGNSLSVGKRWKFTYNITRTCQLTEDRTLTSWDVESILAKRLIECPDRDILRTVFEDKDSYEAGNGCLSYYAHPGPEALEVFEQIIRDDPEDSPQYIRTLYKSHSGKSGIDRPAAVLTGEQLDMLCEAQEFVTAIGIPDNGVMPIICKTLGTGVYGLVEDGKIYLSLLTFETFELLVGTIIEERLHLVRNVPDGRLMQEAMLREIIRLGRATLGETDGPTEETTTTLQDLSINEWDSIMQTAVP